MSCGVKRLIRRAAKRVEEEIGSLAAGGFYAAGLSGEGYAGGYRDALADVLLALNGTLPNRRHYWREEPKP